MTTYQFRIWQQGQLMEQARRKGNRKRIIAEALLTLSTLLLKDDIADSYKELIQSSIDDLMPTCGIFLPHP